MAKHPVPKKKMSNARTAKRFAAFAFKKRRKIEGIVQVIVCPSCGKPMLNQQACRSCGNFRGRSVLAKMKVIEKITKIKA